MWVKRISALQVMAGCRVALSTQGFRLAADEVYWGTVCSIEDPSHGLHIFFRRIMRKRISIDQLKIGMKVEKLDCSWLVTPFLRNKFTVTSAEQIEKLIAIGVQELDVTVEEVSQKGSASRVASDPGRQPASEAEPQAASGKGPKAVPAAGSEGASGKGPIPVSDGGPAKAAPDAGLQATSGQGLKLVPDAGSLAASWKRPKLLSGEALPPSSAKGLRPLSDEFSQVVSASASKPESPATPFNEELREAKQAYHAAKGVIQQAMEDVRMGGALNMEAVQHVVEGMADSILRNPDALTSLSRLKQFDEYTFYHSVNTSLLALSLGRDLGYERPELLQLGTGMLLHDIGKTQIPLELLNKPGRFEEHEFEMMKQHVMRGAELLSSTTGLSDEFLKPTLEHHERVDGTGYPCQHCKADLSEFGLIAAVVDIYDAVTSDRCYHKGKSPHDTLQFLYQLGTSGHVDSAMVQRLVQVVGVYPVGSCVALNTGESAIVLQSNHEFPLRPRVRIVADGTGFRRARPMDLDLSTQAGSLDRTIKGPLDPAMMGVDPQSCLDHDAA